MKRVVYVSTAAPNLADDDVERLAADAVRRNETLDLTGLLAFNGVNFMQALEGEEAAVDEVFGSIRRDSRHGGLVALIEEPCSSRLFPDWRMRYVRAPSRPLLNGQTALNRGDLANGAQVAELFAGFLRLGPG